jgi:glycosyltransferase involved in cell wall biosynthesis
LKKENEAQIADYIICNSKLARNSYIQMGQHEAKVFCIYLGFDPKFFNSEKLCLSNDGVIRFAYVGVPAHHKGYDILKKSFGKLLELGAACELHIIGELDRSESKYSKNIYMHGKKTHHELGLLFKNLDVLVLPSRLDSFGMVVLEALASGLSVITTSNVGASELIINGINGRIIPPNDVESLTNALKEFQVGLPHIRAKRDRVASDVANLSWSRYSQEIKLLMHKFLIAGR